ncbi:right-handed parallel beta-helix repeat-containing protein, partial [Microbulbifer epialgicus]
MSKWSFHNKRCKPYLYGLVLTLLCLSLSIFSLSARAEVLLYPVAEKIYSSKLYLAGVSNQQDQLVDIEINGSIAAQTRTNSTGDFAVFVTLALGSNQIRALIGDSDISGLLKIERVTTGDKVLDGNPTGGGSDIAAPILYSLADGTESNPATLTGTAEPGSTVVFFVNGSMTRSIEVDESGVFSTWVPLEDSENVISAISESGNDQSPISNSVSTTYTNTLGREWSGEVLETMVWTRGDGSPYTISGNLSIPKDITLWIQPGVEVIAESGRKISVLGDLEVVGNTVDRVKFHPSSPACDGVNTSRQDWSGVEILAGGTASIEYAEVHCASNGIYFNGGDGSVTDSRLLNNHSAINMTAPSPDTAIYPKVFGNTINGSTHGINVLRNSQPLISAANEITGNSIGIYASGHSSDPSQNPLPLVTGNSIYDNSSYNYRTIYFSNSASTTLNATGNWWGTTDPGQIALKIYDWTDSQGSYPVVDYSNFLDGPGGDIAYTGGALLGYISEDANLSADSYLVLGRVEVAADTVVTLAPGTELKFTGNYPLLVKGELTAEGTESSPISFKPTAEACDGINTQRKDWPGIEVSEGATATIKFAEIHCATNGVYFNGGDGSVADSQLLYNYTGIRAVAVSTDAAITPQISGNEIRGGYNGIYVYRNSNPLISGGNEISENYYGVYISGYSSDNTQDPVPVVTGNSIYGNSGFNYYASSFANAALTTLDATGNWWGTTDPGQIAVKIYDWTDNQSTSPVVDYRGFLDGADGSSAYTGEALFGYLNTDVDLSADSYLVLGRIEIAVDTALNLNPGTELLFTGNYPLMIKGEFRAQGDENAPIVFKPTAEACDGVNTNRKDWLGIEVAADATATIEYAEIQCAAKGIYFNGGDGSVSNSLFENNYTGIYTSAASAEAVIAPQISANTIRGSDSGIYVYRNSNPLISGGNEITGNTYGIYVYGHSSDTAQNPVPVVTGNSLYGNGNHNYYTRYFSEADSITLDATGNWWGSTDPGQIAAKIWDWTDDRNNGNPVVDIRDFLDGPDGSPAYSGETIFGYITDDTSLSADSYLILGRVEVATDTVLTIAPGAELQFAGKYPLVVEGALSAKGAAGSPVVFKPTAEACDGINTRRSDWTGIEVVVGAMATIEYAEIHCASKGIYFNGGDGSVSNSQLINNYHAIHTAGPSADAVIAPQISGNTISGSYNGIYVYRNSNPVINGGNIITENGHGIYVYGHSSDTTQNPMPVVTGNSIYSNNSYNYYTRYFSGAALTTLDASGNWWGTSDPALIASAIYDWTDSQSSYPVVDYHNFLDGQDGSPVYTGETLIGNITDDVDLSNDSYLVLGRIEVAAGAILTIAPGSELQFSGKYPLRVKGAMEAKGTEASPVVFKPTAEACDGINIGRSDWNGIEVMADATATIEFAEIHCASKGIYFNGGDGSVSNAQLLNNDTGIYTYASSVEAVIAPKISANKFRGNNNGIYVSYNSFPLINGNNEIVGNKNGIYVYGHSSDPAQNPAPIVTGNSIYESIDFNYVTRNFSNGATTTLNATGNWWGTDDPKEIALEIYDWTDSQSARPIVDFRNFLDGPNGTPAYTGETLFGFISEDTDLSNDSHLVLGRVEVAIDVSLTITPGSELLFAGDYPLLVKGKLIAKGTEASPIIFRPENEACDGVNTRRKDWQGIEVSAGATVTMEYTEVHCANNGVYFNGGDGSLSNSQLIGNYTGVQTAAASAEAVITPQISGNTIRGSYNGIYIYRNSNPLITNGNEITNSYYGIYADGHSGDSAQNPVPVVTGNSIYDSEKYNYYTRYFANAALTTLDATGNWWGSVDLALIASNIYDWSDDPSSSPLIDYSGYLNEDGDSAGSGGTLQGRLTSDLTLTGGVYQVLGELEVPAGIVLTIEEGTTISLTGKYSIEVYGELLVTGSGASPVIFMPVVEACDGVNSGRSDWSGIEVLSGATATIEYAEVHCATKGVYFNGGDGLVRNSRLLNNATGIHTAASSAEAVIAPQIVGNEVRGNTQGVYVYHNSAPVITGGNEITGNSIGVYASGHSSDPSQNPLPLVTGNSIYDNSSYNYRTIYFSNSASTTLNATGNWWGTTDPGQIALKIYDWTDSQGSYPVVDYSNFLDGPGGDIAYTGGALLGYISEDANLSADSYLVLGRVEVAADTVVTLAPGTELKFTGNYPLLVKGELTAEGTESSPISFKPTAEACDGINTQRKDWPGIEVSEGATATIKFAEIHCATNGVYFNGGDGSVADSQLLYNYTGIRAVAVSTDAAITPQISGNEIRGGYNGIYVYRNSNPLISGGNEISENYYGVYISGYSSDNTQDPVPVVTGNSIYGNSGFNYYASSFANAALTTLDATGNWWGTTDPGQIAVKIYDWTDNQSTSPVVDYRGFLDGADGSSAYTGEALFGYLNTDVDLSADSYLVLGRIEIAVDTALNLNPGTELLFTGNYPLMIKGEFRAQGDENAPIVFKPTAEACDGVNTNRKDWLGIEVAADATATIEYAEIQCAAKGIYFNGGDGSVSNSLFENNYTGIYTSAASAEAVIAPQISANTIRGSDSGIYVYRNSNPLISGGNEITGNTYGIYVYGHSSDTAQNPVPVVTGNSLYGNGNHNYYTRYFSEADSITLDATGNWWGSTDPGQIAAKIWDWTDDRNNGNPVVDIRDFLDGPDGSPAYSGETIFGYITDDTSLSADSYLILGRVEVATDTVLTIAPGAELQFAGKYPLVVEGALSAKGAAGSPVVFKPTAEACDGINTRRSDWTGIEVVVGAMATIEYAEIHCASKGIYFNGGDGSVSNSQLINNYHAIHTAGPSADAVIAPQISGNTISGSYNGIYVYRNSNPVINGGNIITENGHGIYVYGHSSDTTQNPMPVVTGNSIYSNNSYNYYTRYFSGAALTTLDASGNWWGTSDPALIASAIYDWTDSQSSYPVVDYHNFLDGQDGSPVYTGETLIGNITDDVDLSNDSYLVLGRIEVAAGAILTIAPGSELQFSGKYPLRVKGAMEAKGTEASPVVFKPTAEACDGINIGRSDWNGIEVMADATATIEFAEIHCASKGIYFNGGDGSVSNAQLLNNDTGIYTYASSVEAVIAPKISANKFRGNNNGIYVSYNSFPLINGNNEIVGNKNGIYVYGHSSDPAQNPAPIVTGNSIYESIDFNYVTRNFSNGATTTLNATGNWWGTDDPKEIALEIYDWTDSQSARPIVDFRNFLDGPNGTPAYTGETLFGFISEDTDLSNDSHLVLGRVEVAIDVSLTITPGSELLFAGDYPLLVKGKLIAKGTEASPIIFRPENEACDGVNTRRKDWQGIEVSAGATVTMEYTEVHCANNGVYFNGGDGSLSNSQLIGNYTGVQTAAASAEAVITPQISGNTIRGSYNGIYIYRNSNPLITNGNEITNSYYGIYADGHSGDSAQNPVPVVTGNSIYDSEKYNYYTRYFANATLTTLDATGNWWGIDDPEQIALKIYDWTDGQGTYPVVDFQGYLDGPGGNPAYAGEVIFGYISENTELSGDSYRVLGRIEVAADATLSIAAGSELLVTGNYPLLVKGELSVSGTEVSPIIFKPVVGACDGVSTQRKDWPGIEVVAGGTATIEHVQVHCATNGIYFNGGDGSVKNTELLNNHAGIRMIAASAEEAIAPQVSNNTIRGSNNGIYVGRNSAPLINGGNEITRNIYGIYVYGYSSDANQNPMPVVTGNNIYHNSSYNYYAYNFANPLTIILNATGNWWGSTDAEAIVSSIYDRDDNATYSPLVNYGSYLDGLNGQPSYDGVTLLGPITEDTVLPAGAHLMLQDVVVQPGVTLTLEAGASLKSAPDLKLQIAGNLVAQGTAGSRAVFTSAAATPQAGEWYGIEVITGATVDIDYARIEGAIYGIDFNGGQGTVQHSLFRFNTYGIYIRAGSNPIITNGNEITLNDYGIYVIGDGTATNNPVPVITGNSLYGNKNYSVYVTGFGDAANTSLDVTGNWWGSVDEATIESQIYTAADTSPQVDFSGFLEAMSGQPAV